ncbi:MAG: response regulator transcription factor [Chloroflexi bacterium]|nr:response regulator transcription factor [Chloroflexota bacterium]
MSSSSSRALVLEPDRHLREALAELFKTQGYDVVEEANRNAVISRVIEVDPDVVLLAQEMVDYEKSDIITLLRRLMDGIIVVIGDDGEGELVAALLEGADIYMGKPVNYRELMARVRAYRRRSELGDTA